MFLKSFFLLIAFFSSSHPQFLIEEIYRVTSSENKISEVLDISNIGQLIIRETENNIQKYYLVDVINNPPPKLIFTSSQVQGNSIWFSENSRFIILSLKEADRFKIKIYDTQDETLKELNDPNGDVGYVSIIDKKNILYEVTPPRDYPRIYMSAENGSNPKFIGDGMTPLWSPDGKWFLVKKGEYVKDTSNTKRAKLLGYKIIKKPIYSIYDCNGEKILDIKNHDDNNFIRWSPTSDKIVFTELGDIGFYIIYFKSSDNFITIEKVFHFEGFPKEGENVAFALNPTWSPDANWISYIRNVENGHTILENSIFVYNINTHQQHSVVSYNDKNIEKIIWLSNNELIFLATSIDNTEHFVYKIDIDDLMN